SQVSVKTFKERCAKNGPSVCSAAEFGLGVGGTGHEFVEQTDQFLALSGFERLGPGTLAAIVCAKAPEDGPIACFGQAELQGTSVMGGPFAHQKTVTFQGVQECRQGSPTHTGDLGRGLGLHGPGQPESEDHPKPRPGQSPWSV